MSRVIWAFAGTLTDSHAMTLDSWAGDVPPAGLPELPHRTVSGIVGLSLPVAVETLLPEHDRAIQATVVEGYRTHYSTTRARGESPLFPGARDCLDRLAARDDRLMAVATGKSRKGLDALLAAHGLEGYFIATHCADGHPSKPAPDMVLSCLRDSGADAEAAVMIGDTSFDILMAGNAGIAAIGVAWGHHPARDLTAAGALAVARDFAGLSELIEEWAA